VLPRRGFRQACRHVQARLRAWRRKTLRAGWTFSPKMGLIRAIMICRVVR